MASSPITSWQTEGEKVEVMTDFTFLGSKIIANGDCSHEIKRHLLLGRKAMTNIKWSEVKWSQSCPTLCDPMGYSLPGSSVHGIFQARVLEWASISFYGASSQPRDWNRVSCIADRRFTVWATREAMTNIESVLKSRDTTLLTKVCVVKAWFFQ